MSKKIHRWIEKKKGRKISLCCYCGAERKFRWMGGYKDPLYRTPLGSVAFATAHKTKAHTEWIHGWRPPCIGFKASAQGIAAAVKREAEKKAAAEERKAKRLANRAKRSSDYYAWIEENRICREANRAEAAAKREEKTAAEKAAARALRLKRRFPTRSTGGAAATWKSAARKERWRPDRAPPRDHDFEQDGLGAD